MSTATIKPQGSIVSQPRGITAATIVIIVLWGVLQWNLSAFTFLGVAILFILGFKNPLWAVAAIIISQMTITSYMVATPLVDISLRLIMMLLTLYIIRGSLARKEVDFGPHARMLIIPMVVLVIIGFISNMVNPLTFDMTFRSFRNLFVGLLFIILLPAIVENTRQLRILCSIVLIVALASAIIGIFQHYNILGMSQATLLDPYETANLTATDPNLVQDMTDQQITAAPELPTQLGRIPGMGETELELAFIFPVIIMIALTVFLTRGISSKNRNLILIPILPMLLALWFTYTRSAVYAVGIGIISILLFMRLKIRWEIIMVIMTILVLIVEFTGLLEGTYFGGRSESVQEQSSVARDVLWQAGVAIALDNPIFGIGADRFMEVSPGYAYRVDPALIAWEQDRYWQYSTLGNDEPHNDFLMMWLTHGTPALIVYVIIYFIIIYNLMYAFRNSKNRFVKGVAVGLAAGIITYIANSFYHNLLDTLPLLWIIAGFSLVTAKLTHQEKTRKF